MVNICEVRTPQKLRGYILDQKNQTSKCHNMAPAIFITDNKSYL